MHGWQSGRQEWKFDGRRHWWIAMLAIGGFIMLVSKIGWWWLWLPFIFFFVMPALSGGWQRGGWQRGGHWTREWHGRHEGSRWSMCGGEMPKRKHDMDDEKPKHHDVRLYRADGEVLKVTDAPEKPKRDEYV